MQNAFILRFLENCTPTAHLGAGSGTITKTAVPQEGSDKDAPMALASVFGQPSAKLGTSTATRIKAEHGDADAQGFAFKGSPLATQTRTLIAAEAPDKGHRSVSLFGDS